MIPLVLLLLGGCSPVSPRTDLEQQMFAPTGFRIHPTFTQIKSASDAKKPDGIEAVIEFQDQFGDTTRALGAVRFELYSFHEAAPDHRGTRLATWSDDISTHDEQMAHWDPAARGYSFQLSYPKISGERAYVLGAQFDRAGTRLFDQLVIEPSRKSGYHGDRRTQRAPVESPGHTF